MRCAQDILDIRAILNRHNCHSIKIIAKIENIDGVNNIDEILRVTDGVMVARGDMGVEIPLEEIPVLQKMLIKKAYNAGKQVITATQMLDSMMKNPRPTRAESTDVANAIYDGTSAIMLSGETAAGAYPVESLITMAKIAERAENDIDYIKRFNSRDIMEAPQCDQRNLPRYRHHRPRPGCHRYHYRYKNRTNCADDLQISPALSDHWLLYQYAGLPSNESFLGRYPDFSRRKNDYR